MKKRFAAVLAATAVMGVTAAFAANPFSDVTPDSWAYQSVSQLAAAGIVNGYPDGTFKGQNNITRYEMAQMVAKAMANQDRANAEQQAMINRLADEFATELNNLGVRVARLEDRVGNVKVTGDMRLRFRGSDSKKIEGTKTKAYAYGTSVGEIIKDVRDSALKSEYGKHSIFDMRGRVQFNANVNENTKAVVRVTSGNMEFGNSTSGNASIDRAYVQHQFGDNVTVVAGRQNLVVGNGLAYDDAFDGVTAVVGNDKVKFTAGYGYSVAGLGAGLTKDENSEITYFGVKGKVTNDVTLGGFYTHTSLKLENYDDNNLKNVNVYGFSADYNHNNWWVGGEWLKTTSFKDSAAWTAGVGYGNYSIAKAGTWDVKVQYFNQKQFAPISSSTWNQAYDANNVFGMGYKGWMATVDYALQDNVGLSAYYGFSSKSNFKYNGAKNFDIPDFYRVELNYKF